MSEVVVLTNCLTQLLTFSRFCASDNYVTTSRETFFKKKISFTLKPDKSKLKTPQGSKEKNQIKTPV